VDVFVILALFFSALVALLLFNRPCFSAPLL